MSDASNNTSPWSDATNATAPWHIYAHEATLAAIRKGADDEAVRAVAAEYLRRWYQAGEPVWMAADGLAFAATRRALESRADAEAKALRRRLSGARDGR